MKTIKKYRLGYVLLMILLLLTPLMVMRDVTPANELRYLSIVDEAIEDGHMFSFYNQGHIYADKPPLYFWLMMLCRLIFGEHCIFALSMLSLIPMFGIIIVMDRWMRDELRYMWTPDRSAAFALMLTTCGLFMGLSIFLRMDMLMCLFIVLSLYTFYRMYTGRGNIRKQQWLLPVYVFLALFSKGPVGLLVPPLTIIVFLITEHRLKTVWTYLGWRFWLVLFLLTSGWFFGVWLDGGREYLNNLVFHQTVDRAVNAFHHKEPFWYYFGCIWYLMMPYALLLVPVFVASIVDRGEKRPAEKLFIVTVTVTVLMLSCFSSKLGIYLTPVFPFMVYLLPMYLNRNHWYKWMIWMLAIPLIILLLVGSAGVCLPTLSIFIGPISGLLEKYPFLNGLPVYLGGAALLVGMVVAIEKLFSGKYYSSIIAVGTSLLLSVFFYSYEMNEINPWIGYRSICTCMNELDPEGTAVVHTLHVNRSENMDVYLGHDVVDYGNDVDAFVDDAISTGYLIITQERVETSDRLKACLEGKQVSALGPYSIYCLEGL